MNGRPRGGPLLAVEGLVKHFAVDSFLRRAAPVRAVDHVSFHVDAGEVFSVVGESGSGKTTLTRMILGLERPTAGAILFDGADIVKGTRQERWVARRAIQPVFQDPMASLDPRWDAASTIREALDAQRIGTPLDRQRRVLEVADQVGLPARVLDRRPDELSGGQRQRVCIAAALAPGPRILVADEPVTALDVSVQAQVLNLLHEIQRELRLTVLLVAHDLAVVAHLSDRVAVLHQGRIVEEGTVAAVFDEPQHPYTQALLDAVPRVALANLDASS